MLRHSGATRCSVRVAPTSIEIGDNGNGVAATAGNGLAGLRERAQAAGAVLSAGPVPEGWLPAAAGGAASGGVPARNRPTRRRSGRHRPACQKSPQACRPPGGLARVGGAVSTPIRLLLADDQSLVRGALAALLSLEPDLTVVAEVGTGADVVPAALRTSPDVALLDVEMPAGDGIQAAADLRAALPGCRVLVVTTFGRPGYLRRPMEAGAVGFVAKDTPAGRCGSPGARRAAGG